MLVDDECMRKLLPKLEALAAHLRSAVEGGKFFAIRYHNDCDGICAGVLLYRALKALDPECVIQSFPSQIAVYERGRAYDELGRLNDPRDTVFILVDHGANPESIASLKMLREAGAEIIILDHHPFDRQAEKLASFFISPMMAGGNSSHTAGLLCYELAKLLDPEGVDEKIVKYSLQSDKSEFADKGIEHKEAVAIDYISTFEELDLPFYDGAFDNKEMVDEAYLQAKEKIGKALLQSEHYTETRDFGGYSAVIVKISKFLKKGDYPPRGKIMNEIIAKKGKELGGKPIVCLGIIEDSISFRANKPVLEMGFDANALINELKIIFGSEIQNGGGHSAAAALQANSTAIPAIEREILLLIEKQVGKK
ncbi:MAG: DHH family phosphoesterase [Candidatus Micrarchaeota archaeon]